MTKDMGPLRGEGGQAVPLGEESPVTAVVAEIVAERRRQREVEGWTPEHDDEHDQGELARAAGWYALNSPTHAYTDVVGVSDTRCTAYDLFVGADGFYSWPWHMKWWKPKSRRRDLIRAAALIVAEIERLDRAERIAGIISRNPPPSRQADAEPPPSPRKRNINNTTPTQA